MRHVFISFAKEDEDQVNLLRGQAKNEGIDLEFDDHSVREAYDSQDEDYVKSQIRARIERVSVTIVYCSEAAARSRWVEWEIKESIRQGKGVVGVYAGSAPPAHLPRALVDSGARVVKWGHKAISEAIEQAALDRE